MVTPRGRVSPTLGAWRSRRSAWGRDLRPGDRAIDVYVHKLRAKLETALPGRRFIHTHVGLGYRFSPEPSHAFHKSTTAR